MVNDVMDGGIESCAASNGPAASDASAFSRVARNDTATENAANDCAAGDGAATVASAVDRVAYDCAASDAESSDFLVARAFLYRLFQSLTSAEPTKQNVDLMCSETFEQAMGVCGVSFDGSRYADVRIAVESDCDGFLDAVAGQYTRLFYGPNKLAAPPWESSYVNPDRKIFQRTTLEVRRAYAEQGLRPHRVNRIPDDHLSIELGFLAEMANRACEPTDASASMKASREFLEQHLLRWLPRYAQDVEKAERDGLFPFVAACLNGFVTSDYQHIAKRMQAAND